MAPRHQRRRLPRRQGRNPAWDDHALQYRHPGRKGECELVIGLDFGTSATKVVIQAPDLPGRPSYPVDFGNLAHHSAPFLLPTKLWINGEESSLYPFPHAEPVSNIKTALFSGLSSERGTESFSDEQLDREAIAAVYLALVLRYSRKWFLETKGDIVRQFSPFAWSVNVGVPSPCIEDNYENRVFRRVGKAAWILSTLPENRITLKQARIELDCVDDPEYWEADFELTCDLEIIPEIAAGAVGYALSDLRREGLHVIVDIGASTVDVCTFLLNASDGGDRYSLLIADVKHIGTMRVHYERIAAVKQACEVHADYLQDTYEALDPFPEDIKKYLIREEVLARAVEEAHDLTIDQVGHMMRRTIWHTKLRRHRRAQVWQRGKLPVLVIGGGSHVRSFRSAIDHLDDWLKMHAKNDGISVLPVPVPASFSSSVSEVDQRRLAVAWGLSHRALDVGEIIPADQIPDEEPPRLRNWRDRYVGKDVV